MPVPITLLWIRPDLLIRADFNGTGAVQAAGFWSQARPQGGTLAELAETCLAQAPGCGKRVWVLSDDLWTQVVSVPSSASQGLDATQLSRALSFEAEPLSGLPAMDSQAGFREIHCEIPGQKAFWTTLIEVGTRDHIQNFIEAKGGRLAGILHPAGLPRPLSANVSGQWRRIETWAQTTACLKGNGNEFGGIDVFGFGAGQPRAQTALAAWAQKNDAPHTEWLTENDANAPLDPSWKYIDLMNAATRTAFLASWASDLSAGPKSVPMIPARERPKSKAYHAIVGVGALAASLALCFAHHTWISQSKAAAELALRDIEGPAKEMAELNKKAAELQKQLTPLEQENLEREQESQRIATLLKHRRQQVLELLKNLAEQRPDDVVISRITADGSSEMKVIGVSLEPTLVEELAVKLSEQLDDIGWEVQPQDVQGRQLLSNGGPWEFTFNLKPADRKNAAKPKSDSKVKAAPTSKSRAEVIEPEAHSFHPADVEVHL